MCLIVLSRNNVRRKGDGWRWSVCLVNSVIKSDGSYLQVRQSKAVLVADSGRKKMKESRDKEREIFASNKPAHFFGGRPSFDLC